jgi:hypothetical protein
VRILLSWQVGNLVGTNCWNIAYILSPFQNIRCFSLFLTHMYLDAFQCVDLLILLPTYTQKNVEIHVDQKYLKHLIF